MFLSAAMLGETQEWPFETRSPDYTAARALGLGNAYTAVAEGAAAIFWNPAGLIQSPGVAILGQMKINARQDWAFDPKAIRFSYRGWALGWGNKIAVRLPERTPDFSYYALAVQVGHSLAVGGGVNVRRRHPWPTYQWFGVEPRPYGGILVYVAPRFRVGMAFYGFASVDLGFSHQSRTVLALLRLRWERSRKVPLLFVGGEKQWFRRFALRLGMSDRDPTFGLGVRWRGLRLDYAAIWRNGHAHHFLAAAWGR